jgi:long-chain acyl-CoA synthetase
MAPDQMVTSLPRLLQSVARESPHGAAWGERGPDGSWTFLTWQEAWREVRHRATALRRLGLARADRLAILAPTCRAWQVAEMAGLLAGAVIVGLEPHAPEDQLAFVLDHAEVNALIVDSPPSLAKVPHALRDRLKFVVSLNDTAGDAAANLVSWRDMPAAVEDEEWRDRFPAGEDPAAFLYTAGTTGTPKGILYSHAQILAGCWAIRWALPELRESDSTSCWLPMAHLFQRMINLVAMSRGMKTIFVEDPREILACIQQTRPSVFVGVPRFFEKLQEGIQQHLVRQTGWRKRLLSLALAVGAKRAGLVAEGRKVPWTLRLSHACLDRIILSKIRRVMGGEIKLMISGSAPIAPWLLKFLHSLGWLVLEAYGLSENTVPIAANRSDAYRFGSVGKPLPPNEVRLAEDGEILVRGPGLFEGYYKEERNTDLFTEDGFYRTGDYGRLDADGFLFLLGRKAEIIKTSTGRRISPARVEAVYRRCPHLDQVVVFGDGRKHLVALVTLNPAHPADHDLIDRELEVLGRELAAHERIRAFAILPNPLSIAEGELTPTLKLRRRRIAERHAERIEQLYQQLDRHPHDREPVGGVAEGGR